jgi:energy-coupling factor transport system ATP-binding protein
MIRLEEVTYTYPGAPAPALQDLSFTIPAGQFCALVGPNAAGKSTLAYVLAGFIPHFYHGSLKGKVIVAGKETRLSPLHELILSVGLIFQNPFNQISGTKFTVREEVAFGLENLGVSRTEMLDRVEKTLELVGISALASRAPLSLSGGEMQRVAIAAVLAMQPQVIVLDEPTAQLDPAGSRQVFATVQALVAAGGMTVVMVEHKLEWVATYAERVIALADGRVVADGLPGEVLADEALLAAGVGQTRYTQAARRARPAGLWPAGRRLPVTLKDAIRGFQEVRER